MPTTNAKPEDRYELQPGEDPENKLGAPFVKHLVKDQEQFFTEPTRFKVKDLKWAVPLMLGTAALIASDSWLTKQVPDKPNQLKRSKNISNYGVASLVAIGGSAFLFGHLSHNDHLSEAGLLSGEAAIDSTAAAYLFKEITQRPRPYQGDGNGTFFQGGTSFPSEHSAAAWAIASVWAHEYPGKLSQTLAYGLASAVTLTRVAGQQHFGSDAAIGSLLGWYFGRQVYRAHHDPELGGTGWGDLIPENTGDKTRNPENMGSPYVPVDSWVYPVFDRLAAMGYMHSGYEGMRPWTRIECARLVEEIGEKIPSGDESDSQAQKLYDTLVEEFADETQRLDGSANVGASIDSIYTRSTVISGTPLRDGYHFGQTIINDYGRPYSEGFNNVSGVVAHAEIGPLAFSIQGEYQHAPAVASEPFNVLQAIANADFTTPVPDGRTEINQLNLIDSTISVTFHNTQISFGKQSQWWGPGESGSLLMSNNAEPILMLKIDNVSPYRVPILSDILGPMRAQYFIGRLDGHQFELDGNQLLGPGGITPQPFLDGGKIGFKPTPNLEFGMGFTAMFAGPGLPFTFNNFIRTFYYHNQTGDTITGSNPAKRATSADFSYRVPGLRDWLTIYCDALAVDEISPIGSSRPTLNPGIYISQFPKLHKMEFRAEGIREPLTNEFAPGFVYFGVRRYRSGYTNDGNLIGNWIGRAGRGAQSWLAYSFSPRTSLHFGYRLQEVSTDFIGGGRSTDSSVAVEAKLSDKVSIRGSAQYEQWDFPVLRSRGQSDVAASVQLTFSPHFRLAR